MTKIFQQSEMKRPRTNLFELSHDVKLSGEMGFLIPTLAMEVIPGDRIHLSTSSLCRLAPMLAPMMHRVDVFFHHFFIPNRICWKGWESFIISDTTGNTPPAFPTVFVGDVTPESGDWIISGLSDYLGVPQQPVAGFKQEVNAIPYCAYQKIWHSYYRDENLQASFPFPDEEWGGLVDGDNTSYLQVQTVNPNGRTVIADGGLNTLQMRAWEHDYFTASLPFAQKGAPVTIPFSLGGVTDVPVYVDDPFNTPNTGIEYTFPVTGTGSEPLESFDVLSDVPVEGSPGMVDAGLFAKTSLLTEAGQTTTINDLRTSFAIQSFFEKAARGGTRYTEQILIHFGVKSSDARLQRPEFIGGSKSPIAISEVLNMTGTTDAPQGTMTGHGVGLNGQAEFSYWCEEHGYIMTIMSVVPKTAYQQGIPKHFLKYSDPYDYFFPSFAHLGEQEVTNQEIFTDASDGLDDQTFGYIPRYAEYRYHPSRVCGAFKSSLNFWHMGRIFADRPTLNDQFVQAFATDRIFAVTDPDADHLWMQVVHSIRAVRPIPVFATPSNL